MSRQKKVLSLTANVRTGVRTYQNIEAMYADIYKEMVMGKIAEELEQEVWLTRKVMWLKLKGRHLDCKQNIN